VGVLCRPVFSLGRLLHALVSHELRAPSVTCERVPGLSGVILVPLLANSRSHQYNPERSCRIDEKL
jgi:hypothetical protein